MLQSAAEHTRTVRPRAIDLNVAMQPVDAKTLVRSDSGLQPPPPRAVLARVLVTEPHAGSIHHFGET